MTKQVIKYDSNGDIVSIQKVVIPSYKWTLGRKIVRTFHQLEDVMNAFAFLALIVLMTVGLPIILAH